MNAIPLPATSGGEESTGSGVTAPGTVDLLAVWSERIRRGDEEAFEALFRTRRDALVARTARLMGGDRSAAHDVVQETFVRLWERRDRIDPGRSIDGWLHRTARNAALNRLRDARTRAELLEERADEAPSMGSRIARPDEALASGELERRLSGWIDELPERQREALSLTRFHGYDHAEAATLMGCSPRTVNNHLVRALKVLRGKLADYAPDLWHR